MKNAVIAAVLLTTSSFVFASGAQNAQIATDDTTTPTMQQATPATGDDANKDKSMQQGTDNQNTGTTQDQTNPDGTKKDDSSNTNATDSSNTPNGTTTTN